MTNARERFAREVAAGKSQADAYREAFPRSRYWKPETLHKRASELAATGEVLGRVAELRREADAAAIMECSELRTILTARVRELAEAHAPTRDLCRASDTLARVSGWYSPAGLAVAVSSVSLSPEERERRINEILGIPNDPPAANLSPEERERRIREALGIPEPTPEERARRFRETMGWPVEDATPAPQPLPAPVPAPCEAEEVAPIAEDEDGDSPGKVLDRDGPLPAPEPAAVEPEPVAVEETPERRERLARILAFVKRHGATTRAEARALALTFEGGSVIGSEATAVADAWAAEQQTGGDND